MLYEVPYHTEDLSGFHFLVTGGAGFIGSNLVEYLMRYGAGRVTVLDDLSNGLLTNLESWQQHPAFRLVEGSIQDMDTCRRACEGVDFVLHQAALGSVPRSVKDPVATNAVNVHGTLQLLFAAHQAGVRRFVYASSSSVYGDNPTLPKTEKDIGRPLSPYAVSKYTVEQYGSVFWHTYQLPTIGFRYFNVFGPRQNPNLTYAAVIPLFAKAVLNGQSPLIYGDGLQSRDFTFVENVVQANIRALFCPDEAAFGQVFNVGNGTTTSVLELAQIIAEEAGTDIEPVHAPPRLGDIRDSLADITKARELLGYDPRFSFRQGIRLTMGWYAEAFRQQTDAS